MHTGTTVHILDFIAFLCVKIDPLLNRLLCLAGY